MHEFLYQLSPYAPVVIFIATTLDVFFLTGLFLYGGAMLGSVAMMHATGMITAEMIIVSAYAGSMLGHSINYTAGRFFSHIPRVARTLEHKNARKARDYLRSRGLFIFMIFGCFVTITRPLYALLIGSLHIKFSRFFLYEAIISLFWIVFWLAVILYGEAMYFWLFR